MKKTAIDWAPNIPDNWQEVRLKDIARLQSGNGITSDDIDEIGDYPVYGGNGMRGYTDSYTNCGDYVLIGRQGALCGNINYATGCFYASEHAVVVYPYAKKESVTWLGETLRTANLNRLSSSAAQPGLAVGTINRIMIPLPPKEERERIGHYLDKKTSAIDNQIEMLEKKQKLYVRLKSATINRAVTQGLNENVKLKDSGVDWIGVIPEHWTIRRIKDVVSDIFMGVSPIYEYDNENQNYVFGQRNNQLYGIDFDGIKFAKDDFFESRPKKEFLKFGDVLLNTLGGGSVGRTGYYDKNDGVPVITDGHVMILRSKKYNTKFMYYYLYSQRGRLEMMAVGSTNQAFFNVSDIREISLPTTSLNEQQSIVSYLDERCAKIDAASAIIDKQIKALNRLKRSLINEVVTGQRAV